MNSSQPVRRHSSLSSLAGADPSVPAQRVAFGASGHRGSAFQVSFNEWHVREDPGDPRPRTRQRRAYRRTEGDWFAARPSGTEDIYKIYAESFRGADHLRRILEEAQAMVDAALAATERRGQ